jgi:hypothetical protein
VSSFQRAVAINAGVLASAAILLAVTPATVSPDARRQASYWP